VIQVILWTCLKVGVALLILALFDYGYQRWKHERDLRMTAQEVREELKKLQGDPQIIARRRAIQRQLVLNRIGATVPKADVVVTNPTELAIAIQYDLETMEAPIVVAKGAGAVAQRIRRIALEHQVPIVERKELARALYRQVDVGRPIPPEQYAAMAEVLRYVYQLKGKTLPATERAA
jgi:flagellar biosynthetic protein FlhB